MYSEEAIKAMMDMLTDPLFKKNFFDFFGKMQVEGIEAAKKFWNMHPDKTILAGTPDFFEKLVDFYIILGFVPHYKYEEALKEKDRLRKEVEFLKETLKEFQSRLLAEGAEKSQEIWKAAVDKQLDINREIAKNFFEMFRELKGEPGKGR